LFCEHFWHFQLFASTSWWNFWQTSVATYLGKEFSTTRIAVCICGKREKCTK
jgi:hypothetical protein